MAFSRYLDGQGIDVDGYNYLLGAGLLPGVELFARLAANTVDDNCYTERCGVRDLSASLKWQLPDAAPLFDAAPQPWLPRVALGATDLGGASAHFRSYYGVATWNQPLWAVSLGLAKPERRPGPAARLSGPFGSVVLQPWPWVQAIVEHDGTDPQAGLRLLTPAGLLPRQLTLQAELRTGAPRDPKSSRSVWWGVSARLPLSGDVQRPTYVQSWVPAPPASAPVAAVLPPAPVVPSEAARGQPLVTAAGSVTEPAVATGPLAGDLLPAGALADRLGRAGFQDIRIGRRAGRWVVAVENQAYAWNDLDALGVALGEFTVWAAGQTAELELELYKQGQVVLRVQSDTGCLSGWLQRGETCAAGVLRFPADTVAGGRQTLNPRAGETDVHWLVDGDRPARWRPRLELAPDVNYAVGTEYGVIDYSAGLAATLELPVLWPGLVADVRYIEAVDESKDYRAGGAFAASALKTGVDRIMLHQYLTGPWGLSAHAAAGRLFDDYEGGFVEGRWQSASGQHELTGLTGDFENPGKVQAKPALLGYRYQFPNDDVQLSVKAGEFFDMDRGYVLSARFAYGDTFVSVFYRSTQTDARPDPIKYAGVQLSLPLTPRRNRPLAFGQLRGTGEYNQSLQTRVGGGANFLAGSGQRGRLATAPQSLDQKLHNRDRLSPAYVLQQLPRLRNAYERYVATAWQYTVALPAVHAVASPVTDRH